MPTVVDSLVVTLSLDASKFTPEQKRALESLRKTKDAAQESAKATDAWGKQTAGAVGLVRNSVLRLVAAYVGLSAVKQFTVDTTNAVAAQGRLAQSIGISTRELALWQSAVRLFGGSGQAAGQSLSGLAQSIAELQVTGQSPIVPWLNKLLGPQGWLDAEGHVKTFTRLYLDLARAVTSGEYTPAQATYFLKQIGLDQDTINLLLQGQDAVQKFLDKAKAAGLASGEQSEALQKLQTSWINYANAMESVGRKLLTDVAPLITEALDSITKSVESSETKPTNFGGVGRGEAGARGILPPGAARSSLSLFEVIQRLEGSGPNAVSNKGAVGRNQITPDTARTYGADPSRLSDPAYNDVVARVIEADLSRKYGGDTDAIAVAYNAGPRAADRWLASGRNDLTLPAETQRYLARERAITGGGGAGSTSVVINGNIVVNTRATDGPGVARAIGGAIQNNTLVTPANQGPQ